MCRLNLAIIALFYAFYGRPSGVLAELVYRATSGDTVNLSCSTKPGTTVSWQYRGPYTEGDRYLCITGNILPDYKVKLALTGDSTQGEYTLTINSVTFNDSGIYTCTEDDGLGQKTSIRLDVRLSAVENVETSTKKMDHAGLSGSAVGLVFSLIFILIIVVIFLVLLTVWCWKKQRSRHRNSKKWKEEELLNADNNNEHANVLSESLNFVSGIALVNNKLFVLRSRDLCVYGTSVEPYVQLVQPLQVPGLGAHTRNDMTSCAMHHSLYISDYINCRVIKLELDEKFEIVEVDDERVGKRAKVIFWDLKEYGMPSGVSVTDHHTLLVSCFEGRKLLQLTIEGKLLNEVKPSVIHVELHLYCPMQAIEVNKQFILCHGGDGIWLLNEEGRIIKTLDSAGLADMPAYAQLAWPCNLAVGTNGHIYVADHYNDRVVELDSELKYVREVVTRARKIFRPRRLYFDKERKMLYFGVLTGDVYGIDVKADGGGDIKNITQ